MTKLVDLGGRKELRPVPIGKQKKVLLALYPTAHPQAQIGRDATLL